MINSDICEKHIFAIIRRNNMNANDYFTGKQFFFNTGTNLVVLLV